MDDLFDVLQTKIDKVFVLVIYDVVNNRKRTKLAKFLNGYGFRIQKSAFEANLTKRKCEDMIARLQQFEGEEDSIRIYKLSGHNEVTVIGKEENSNLEEVIII